MAKVSRNVPVEHLIGNLYSTFRIAIANIKIRYEVLQHDLDVAGARNSAAWLGNFLLESLEFRQERRWIFLGKDLLD